METVSAKRAFQVAMLGKLYAYPQDCLHLPEVMKKLERGEKLSWGTGDTWAGDVFAWAFSVFRMPTTMYTEMLQEVFYNIPEDFLKSFNYENETENPKDTPG